MKTETDNQMEQAINHSQFLPLADGDEKASASVEQTDALLVARILAGDEQAFAVLFDRYRRLVAHLVSRFFYRREEIEEIVQQSFTKIYFSLKNFRGERDKSLSAWLSRITVNLCYDELRRRQRRPENRFADFSEEENEILIEAAKSDSESVESFLMKRDLAEKLLSKLEAKDRLAVTLFYGEEHSIEEVAELVGWSPGNVKVRLFRARNFLREVFKKF